MKERSRKRRASFGAAMAEGGVVLPVLAIFFGIMMYVHNSYAKKMDLQAQSRFAAFSNAAHACEGAAEGATSAAGEQKGAEVEIPAEGDAADQDKDLAVESTWLETTANKTGTATALRRTRQVTALSSVYCNPKTLGAREGIGKLFKFVQHAFTFVSKWAKGLI